jgi:hypothetical protein
MSCTPFPLCADGLADMHTLYPTKWHENHGAAAEEDLYGKKNACTYMMVCIDGETTSFCTHRVHEPRNTFMVYDFFKQCMNKCGEINSSVKGDCDIVKINQDTGTAISQIRTELCLRDAIEAIRCDKSRYSDGALFSANWPFISSRHLFQQIIKCKVKLEFRMTVYINRSFVGASLESPIICLHTEAMVDDNYCPKHLLSAYAQTPMSELTEAYVELGRPLAPGATLAATTMDRRMKELGPNQRMDEVLRARIGKYGTCLFYKVVKQSPNYDILIEHEGFPAFSVPPNISKPQFDRYRAVLRIFYYVSNHPEGHIGQAVIVTSEGKVIIKPRGNDDDDEDGDDQYSDRRKRAKRAAVPPKTLPLFNVLTVVSNFSDERREVHKFLMTIIHGLAELQNHILHYANATATAKLVKATNPLWGESTHNSEDAFDEFLSGVARIVEETETALGKETSTLSRWFKKAELFLDKKRWRVYDCVAKLKDAISELTKDAENESISPSGVIDAKVSVALLDNALERMGNIADYSKVTQTEYEEQYACLVNKAIANATGC